jgi:peptidoglycan DL-endopeptidase CwlO
VLGLPALHSTMRRSRVAALATVVAASVFVPVLSASPAQAVVAPTAGVSAATATIKGSSAATTTKAKGAKKVKKKHKNKLTPKRIIKTARKYDGSYYRTAGTTPSGFDCSGYTRYVFGKLGRSLPHNSGAQYSVVKHVSRKHARKGDLIFFRSSSGSIYHVGIFAGHGRLYHASQHGVRTGLGKIYSWHVSFGRA